MWTYHQRSGQLFHNGRLIGRGYSGDGPGPSDGCNNPSMEAVRNRGPIPRGRWRIGPPHRSRRVGPHAMALGPVGHDAHGRTAFMIHGDDRDNDASRGCIILSRILRQQISASGDPVLEVLE